ncbi:Serine/threonine-protein kinase PknD [Streptomyces microflavus]
MDTTLQDPLVGQLLDGRYRIEARIAVGGMATVYRAVDTRLDRVLALKVMHPALAVDAAFVERFIREAKSVARLAHPNVVAVFDQGAQGAYVYLAMEYVAGCTLRDVPPHAGVPDVTGRDVDEARTTLEEAGFEVKVDRPFLSFSNTIASQSVEGGEQAAEGSTITIRTKGF